MTAHNFRPAAPDEQIVHGACRPGYRTDQPAEHVGSWLTDMQDHGIERVCCLLDEKLSRYDGLLEQYADVFGPKHVCHAPVEDFTAISTSTLEDIWPFLQTADQANSPTVVHCSAGMGRTGQVLALWLAAERGQTLSEAIQTTKQMGRSPLEAATPEDLQERLSFLRKHFS